MSSVEDQDDELIISIRLENSRSKGLQFYLEPWGEEFLIPPGVTLEVRARGPRQNASFHVEFGHHSIKAYGWTGSTVQIFHAGEELGVGLSGRPPVPSVPPGSDVASFVKSLFGKRKT